MFLCIAAPQMISELFHLITALFMFLCVAAAQMIGESFFNHLWLSSSFSNPPPPRNYSLPGSPWSNYAHAAILCQAVHGQIILMQLFFARQSMVKYAHAAIDCRAVHGQICSCSYSLPGSPSWNYAHATVSFKKNYLCMPLCLLHT